MAERSILFDLKLDIASLEKNSKEASERLEELKVKQKELKETSGTNTVEYAKLSNEIRATAKELKDNASAIEINERLNKKNTGSLNEQSEALKSAKVAYRNLSEEQRKSPMGEEMRKRIDEMNQSLKDSESAYGDNQRNVGNYSDALSGLGGPIGQATNGIKSMSASLKALLANPVVLVISGIVGVLALLYKSFTKTEEGGNKVNKLFTILSGVFSTLLKAIKPVADFMVKGLVKSFELVGKGVDKLVGGLTSMLDFLGFDSMAEGIRDVNNESKELLNTTIDIANREAELIKLRREQRKIQMQYQLDAEKLRQIRDDESLSMEERYKANEDLGKLLAEQSAKELAIAQKELDLINKKIGLEGETAELLDARAEAELQLIDINERITGQQSEQLVNINSLRREEEAHRKERIAKQKEANDKLIELQRTLQDIILDNEDKTNANQLAIIERRYNDLFRLNENNTDALIDLEKQKNDELNALDEQQKEDDLTRLQTKLDRELDANKGNLKIQEQLTRAFELDKQNIELEFEAKKIDRENALIDREKEHNKNRLENERKATNDLALINAELNLKNAKGLENEQEMFKAFQDEKIRIIRENALREIELNNLVGVEADKVRAKALLDEKNVLDTKFEAKKEGSEKEIEVEEWTNEQKTEMALTSANQLSGAMFQVVQNRLTKELNAVTDRYDEEALKLQNQLDQGLISETEYLTAKNNIDDKFRKDSAKIKQEQFKRQKQADLIQSTINTALAVTKALSSAPVPINFVLAGVSGALGAVQTGLIASQPIPKFAKGGVFGGKSHSNGGTKGTFEDGTQIEVEKDEAFFILNRNATKQIGLLDRINRSTGGVPLMQNGGRVQFESGISAINTANQIDARNNANNDIMNAISKLPRPVVAVQDINEAQGNLTNIVDFASF